MLMNKKQIFNTPNNSKKKIKLIRLDHSDLKNDQRTSNNKNQYFKINQLIIP